EDEEEREPARHLSRERSTPALRPRAQHEHRSDEPADRAGGSDAERRAEEAPGDRAERAAHDPGAEIERQKASSTDRTLEEGPGLPQDEQVEAEMEDRPVEEARGHERLEPRVRDREGRVVAAEPSQDGVPQRVVARVRAAEREACVPRERDLRREDSGV